MHTKHYYKKIMSHCSNINGGATKSNRVIKYMRIFWCTDVSFMEAVTIDRLAKYIYRCRYFFYRGGHDYPSCKIDLQRRSQNNHILKSIYGGGPFKRSASKNGASIKRPEAHQQPTPNPIYKRQPSLSTFSTSQPPHTLLTLGSLAFMTPRAEYLPLPLHTLRAAAAPSPRSSISLTPPTPTPLWVATLYALALLRRGWQLKGPND